MFDEAEFQRVADCLLTEFSDKIEDADNDGVLECDMLNGVLTINSDNNATWIVSKHAPSKQIWLASRQSGGLHFDYRDGKWQLADGRVLNEVLAAELHSVAKVEVAL